MSQTDNDDGRVKITDQDVLKVFDATDDPVLTAGEIAEALPVTRQAVNYRLQQMLEKGLVDRKKSGARAVVWWATVAPRLSAEAERQAKEAERENAVSQEEMKRRLGMDG
jgi:predicted transcriptional regulator